MPLIPVPITAIRCPGVLDDPDKSAVLQMDGITFGSTCGT
jgi:hypothetical protein